MFLEEWFHVLDVHSVVLVGVEFECGRLQHLVPEAAVVEELGVLLVVVAQAGHLAALPRQVAQEVRTVHAAQEEQAVVHERELGDILELDGVSGLYHFYKRGCS